MLTSQHTTKSGKSIIELSFEKPVLLVFLRHFGCSFCREAMADIRERKDQITNRGVNIILVHMATHEVAEEYFEKYELDDLDSISDPNCEMYQSFGLVKGNFKQLFGLRSWIRGFEAGVVQGHGVGPMLGDGFQMPGVFLIKDGKIENRFIHQFASDRPDYSGLLDCCVPV